MPLREKIEALLTAGERMSFSTIATTLNAKLPTVSKAVKSSKVLSWDRVREGHSWVSYAFIGPEKTELEIESKVQVQKSKIENHLPVNSLKPIPNDFQQSKVQIQLENTSHDHDLEPNEIVLAKPNWWITPTKQTPEAYYSTFRDRRSFKSKQKEVLPAGLSMMELELLKKTLRACHTNRATNRTNLEASLDIIIHEINFREFQKKGGM